MEKELKVRNANGKLICILKKNEHGMFCETKGKHTQEIPLEDLKAEIESFERNVK